MSIEDADVDALLEMAKLDGDSGPARPLDRTALAREVAGLVERRDAVLRARGKWYAGATIGGLVIGASLVATLALGQAPTPGDVAPGVEAPLAAHPTVPAPLEEISAAPEIATARATELEAVDVAALPSVIASVRTSPASAPPAPASLPSRSDVEEVEDLLRTANRLRADKSWAEAARTYERVIERYESSGQAYPAMLAAAALRLERLSDPSGALRLYQRALRTRPTGSLTEEASFGEARSHRALGQSDAERSALQRFVSSHPSSWRADQARARLRELGDGSGRESTPVDHTSTSDR
ncbi:MAG: hypothetical protein BGO98_37850 [Myxococcales bacterium 68-20]|nr:MAG: hypothetical protein BGO98_37850 [Myxococcales bacterium 68-20]